ncbi:elongation factor P [Mycoplasmatota bacterium WC30]
MISTSDFKTGLTLEYDKNIYSIIDFQHVKPGKGSAFVRTKLRNLRANSVIDITFNSGEKFNLAQIDKSIMQFLYMADDVYVFMNNETYDQIELHVSNLKNEVNYLSEGMNINIISYGDEILGLELPDKVVLEIVETAGGVKGNTTSNSTKEALTNTGYRLSVPLFVNEGDKIVVSTATGKYDTRVR